MFRPAERRQIQVGGHSGSRACANAPVGRRPAWRWSTRTSALPGPCSRAARRSIRSIGPRLCARCRGSAPPRGAARVTRSAPPPPTLTHRHRPTDSQQHALRSDPRRSDRHQASSMTPPGAESTRRRRANGAPLSGSHLGPGPQPAAPHKAGCRCRSLFLEGDERKNQCRRAAREPSRQRPLGANSQTAEYRIPPTAPVEVLRVIQVAIGADNDLEAGFFSRTDECTVLKPGRGPSGFCPDSGSPSPYAAPPPPARKTPARARSPGAAPPTHAATPAPPGRRARRRPPACGRSWPAGRHAPPPARGGRCR